MGILPGQKLGENDFLMRPFGSGVLPKKLWPINRSHLHIQNGCHQYVAIDHISQTSRYNIVNNGSIPRFFCMANSLMLLVLCFKMKVMHWVKAIGHFKPTKVGTYFRAL